MFVLEEIYFSQPSEKIHVREIVQANCTQIQFVELVKVVQRNLKFRYEENPLICSVFVFQHIC